MTITINTKEELSDIVKAYLLEDFLKSLEDTDLSQEEKDANVILAKRKMQADANNISELIYRAYGLN